MTNTKNMSIQSIFLAFFVTISIISCSETDPKPSGFTVDLIHRDATKSPSQRIVNALRRSLGRHSHLNALNSSRKSESEISASPTGEYVMKYSIGTPPVTTFGIADTGSDLTWTQCPPCIQCFKQKAPLFNPTKSSTYRKISCKDDTCLSLTMGSCSHSRGNCLYHGMYGDGSESEGELAWDTITLGSGQGKTESFPNFAFGCGFKNSGIFYPEESGIIGLGAGKNSLIGQLNPSIQGKFSYCLTSLSSQTGSTSKIHFGTGAVVSGAGVVSTPMLTNQESPFYMLTLEGMTVGNQRFEVEDVELSGKSSTQDGNTIIIDSGTILTYLPDGLYEKVETKVKSMINLKPVPDPQGIVDLCYNTPKGLQFADMIVHFKGADVRLKTENSFVTINNGVTCLAFKASALSIYGSLAQANFLVGYDVLKRTVSFKPSDCSRSS